MGTVCATSYTNILEDNFERNCIYSLTEGKSLTYFRNIDYIFFICIGQKINWELDQFFKDLNENHSFIKFDYKASK